MTFCYDVIFDKIKSKIKNQRFICKTTDLGEDVMPFLTTVFDSLYNNSPELFFYGKNRLFLWWHKKKRHKLKIKVFFTKLQTLGKTHMPFLMTFFDSLYENSSKLFFYSDLFVTSFLKKIRQKMKIKQLFAKLQILGNTPILSFKTNLDSLYENFPKQDYIEYLANTTLNAASCDATAIHEYCMGCFEICLILNH